MLAQKHSYTQYESPGKQLDHWTAVVVSTFITVTPHSLHKLFNEELSGIGIANRCLMILIFSEDPPFKTTSFYLGLSLTYMSL